MNDQEFLTHIYEAGDISNQSRKILYEDLQKSGKKINDIPNDLIFTDAKNDRNNLKDLLASENNGKSNTNLFKKTFIFSQFFIFFIFI